MFVSFVVPTLNQAGFIRKCLDSCLAQNLPEYEILVVDGLSTDGTQEILTGYGDKIRWVSERDTGTADAVNKGIRWARGEIIAWINSDDYYAHPGVLRRVLDLWASEPEVDILYGDGLMVGADGVPLRPYRGRELRSLKGLLIRPSGIALQPAVFFRKRLFESVGGLEPRLLLGFDYDLWLRMFPQARKFKYVPECFACAVYHSGAKSIYALRKQIVELCQLKRQYAPQFRMSLIDRWRMRLGMASLYAYWLAVRLGLRRGS